jgi:hypothetical protein
MSSCRQIGRSRSVGRSLIGGFLTVATVGIAVSTVGAHDFFLVPGSVPYRAGADAEILAHSSSRFPTSAGAVAVARVAKAVIVGPAGETPITDFTIRGTSLVLRTRPQGSGQRLVGVDLVSRSARQTPAELLRWLTLEGAGDASARIERSAALQGLDSITRTDAKRAKTIIQVGRRGPRVFNRKLGQTIEFIPLSDPSDLKPGDSLRARLEYKGTPVPGISVHASVPAPEDTTRKAEPDLHLVTNAAGIVSVPVRKRGLWLIRTIHVVEANRGAWETHWASLVFQAGR